MKENLMTIHCVNRLKITGPVNDTVRFRDLCQQKKEAEEKEWQNYPGHEVTFGPLAFDWFHLTPDKYIGTETFFQWRVENWGTKWNPYEFSDDEFVEQTMGDTSILQIQFQTADNAPTEFFVHISKQYPTLEFVLTTYYGVTDDVKRFVIKNGKVKRFALVELK